MDWRVQVGFNKKAGFDIIDTRCVFKIWGAQFKIDEIQNYFQIIATRTFFNQAIAHRALQYSIHCFIWSQTLLYSSVNKNIRS